MKLISNLLRFGIQFLHSLQNRCTRIEKHLYRAIWVQLQTAWYFILQTNSMDLHVCRQAAMTYIFDDKHQ